MLGLKMEKMVTEIVGYYEDPVTARRVLTLAMLRSPWNPDRLRIFRDTERSLYKKRLTHNTPRKVKLLEMALND